MAEYPARTLATALTAVRRVGGSALVGAATASLLIVDFDTAAPAHDRECRAAAALCFGTGFFGGFTVAAVIVVFLCAAGLRAAGVRPTRVYAPIGMCLPLFPGPSGLARFSSSRVAPIWPLVLAMIAAFALLGLFAHLAARRPVSSA